MSYELYPLQKEIWRERIRYDNHLRRIFRLKPDQSQKFKEEIRSRLGTKERPNWVIIQITGETGEFKSSTGLAITKELIDPTFDTKRVTMEYNEFEEFIQTSKPGQAFMLDEQVFQMGLGSHRIKQNMVNITETLRKRQNSLVLITPKEKYINEEDTTFTLEPCGYDKKTHTVRLLIKKTYPIGFYYQKLLWNSDLWNKYEKLKDAFIDKTRMLKYKKYDYDKQAMKLHKDMPENYKKKKKRIVLYVEKNSPNITKEERDLLIEQVSILIEQEEEKEEEEKKW